MAAFTTIQVGDRITIVHPMDQFERTGVVRTINHMAERDDIKIDLPIIGEVIICVKPGTKARPNHRHNTLDDEIMERFHLSPEERKINADGS